MLARLRAAVGRPTILAAATVFLGWLAIYLSTTSPTVNFIDSGELITALYEPGIAHPPGYPLYVLLGYVASHLLPGEVAWRVNAFSAFWGAMAVLVLFLLLLEVAGFAKRSIVAQAHEHQGRASKRQRKQGASAGDTTQKTIEVTPSPWPELVLAGSVASLVAASSSFWSRTAQAKMYTLHYFFAVFLFLAALKYRAAFERGDRSGTRRWLLVTALAGGLSLTNHMMTILLAPGLLVVLLAGSGWRERLNALLKNWYIAVPAAVLPLLLYLYLPMRSSQSPVMNWGAPTTWDDFYRHITGWQYRVYLFGTAGDNLERVVNYASQQWSLLTPAVLLAAAGGAYVLARASSSIFAATAATAAMTFVFALAYGISEIEPYMVPFYIMLTVWLGGGSLAWFAGTAIDSRQTHPQEVAGRRRQWLVTGAVTVALLVLVCIIFQYPRQNHRDDRLAEQFVQNVFAELPQNSVLITDYWDFYAPTYYLQHVRGLRPDIAIVDKSLLRYPWYLGQLERRHPFLIENSRDLVEQFATEQRKWVNGERFDAALLDRLYLDLLTSFVDRNARTHSAYLLMLPPCDDLPAPARCESNAIAPGYTRHAHGLATRLLRVGDAATVLPTEPNYALTGILGSQVPMDEFARINSVQYARAYRRLAQLYTAANDSVTANRMLERATEIEGALDVR
ncbi:MAG: DUF2723 domain-containing protein [Chloroflexota bacterium]|nr:DUF2723 domain-containing protein [Chloroflexota bacterium]